MTCKDCLYHERCHSEIAYGMGSDDLTGRYYTDIETRCKGFKNKADYVEVVRCKNCKDFNTNFLTRDALDLINRQKAEIEQLKIENRILSQKRISFPERLEIDRKARAEAVKEFAERLKEHKIDVDVSFGYGKEVYTEAVAVIEIDNLVKEMVGENNG